MGPDKVVLPQIWTTLIEVHEGSRGTTKLTAPLGSGEGLFGYKGALALPLDDGFAHGGLARQASL